MELLQLKYFLESSESESFSKTAKKFMVPTSTVSASVKRLENELGVKLFERTHNKIYLNKKGRIFAKGLKEAFGIIDNSISDITLSKDEAIEIRILIKVRRKWITDLIIKYKETHPEVNFRIFNDNNMLDSQEFDFIIDEQNQEYEMMEKSLLSLEKICIKASKNNPLTKRKIKFIELKEHPFIITRKNSGIRKILENCAKRNGFTPNISIECNDSYCLTRYVEADMGLSLGSERALSGKLEKELTALDVVDFNETQSVYVYHRRFSERDASFFKFYDFLISNKKGAL